VCELRHLPERTFAAIAGYDPPSGSLEALDQADANRIRSESSSRALRRECRWLAIGRRQHVDAAAHQIGGHGGQKVVLTAIRRVLDHNVLALDKAAFGQSLAESDEEVHGILRRARLGSPRSASPAAARAP
jgi:hypothetical protein